jgi:DNA-binding NtrC family response regulator
MSHALLVDDSTESLDALRTVVEREGFSVTCAGTLAEACEAIESRLPDVILLDLKLPDGDGLELLERLDMGTRPDVVLITGHASVATAVAALRERVADYLIKPVDLQRLRSVLHHVIRTRDLREEVDSLRLELRQLGRFGRFVGRSPAMQEVFDRIARVAPTEATVLVTGESGTGKELVAHTIHELSVRRHGPFRAVNCGAIATELLESELFGHEKGSFTGAERRHQGYFEQASSGTLFLDEITEMAPESQVKLLRVCESGEMTMVGGEKSVQVDVRVIAATNQPPVEAIERGKLREDLYYRLKVFSIDVPPLRDRGDDIGLLAQHLLQELNRADPNHEQDKRFGEGVVEALMEYSWPGNVRELKNVVQSAFILANDTIGLEDLAAEVVGGDRRPVAAAGHPPSGAPGRGAGHAAGSGPDAAGQAVAPGTTIAEAERQLIDATLEHCGGNRTKAAEMLGISVKTLYNRLKDYADAEE